GPSGGPVRHRPGAARHQQRQGALGLAGLVRRPGAVGWWRSDRSRGAPGRPVRRTARARPGRERLRQRQLPAARGALRRGDRDPGGVIASIDSSWLMPQGAPTWGGLTLDVVGDRAFASMDAFGQRVDGFDQGAGSPLWLEYGPNLDALMMEAFLEVVRTGAEPPVDGRGGYRSMAVALAALESARTGRAVELAPLPWA